MFAPCPRPPGDEVLVLANFCDRSVEAELDADWSDATLLLGNYADAAAPTVQVVLRPWEAVVFRRTS